MHPNDSEHHGGWLSNATIWFPWNHGLSEMKHAHLLITILSTTVSDEKTQTSPVKTKTHQCIYIYIYLFIFIFIYIYIYVYINPWIIALLCPALGPESMNASNYKRPHNTDRPVLGGHKEHPNISGRCSSPSSDGQIRALALINHKKKRSSFTIPIDVLRCWCYQRYPHLVVTSLFFVGRNLVNCQVRTDIGSWCWSRRHKVAPATVCLLGYNLHQL